MTRDGLGICLVVTDFDTSETRPSRLYMLNKQEPRAMTQEPILASFIGVDLAWSERNPSGLAHVIFDRRGGILSATDHLTSDDEIVAWVEDRAGDTTWVGI